MPSTRLVWKWRRASRRGETPVGPAWIVTLGEDGKRTGGVEDLAGGKWIARDEAIRFARENGHETEDVWQRLFESAFGIVLAVLIVRTILFLIAWVVLSGAVPPT